MNSRRHILKIAVDVKALFKLCHGFIYSNNVMMKALRVWKLLVLVPFKVLEFHTQTAVQTLNHPYWFSILHTGHYHHEICIKSNSNCLKFNLVNPAETLFVIIIKFCK